MAPIAVVGTSGMTSVRAAAVIGIRRKAVVLVGLLLLLIAAPIAVSSASAQATTPLECDGQFYGMQNGNQLFRIDFTTTPFTYSQLGVDTPFR